MRKKLLAQMQRRLQEMRRELLRDLEEARRLGRTGIEESGRDTYDLASDERDREISLILSDRDRVRLQAIDEALDRIEEGTYGICESCEEEIGAGRLEALPFTRLCVNCQSEKEREERTMSRRAPDRLYRRLGTTEIDEEG